MKSKRLRKAQQRVAVARDVIAQLKTETYRAEHGAYVESNMQCPIDQNILLQRNPKCRVCACGSLVLSSIRLYNKFIVPVDASDEGVPMIADALTALFSQTQIVLIESAFEGWSLLNSPKYLNREYETAEANGEQWSMQFPRTEPTKHIIAIMKNIIKNNGTFIPEKN